MRPSTPPERPADTAGDRSEPTRPVALAPPGIRRPTNLPTPPYRQTLVRRTSAMILQNRSALISPLTRRWISGPQRSDIVGQLGCQSGKLPQPGWLSSAAL